jgi:aminoglycoside 3-N-acetyltransferase I
MSVQRITHITPELIAELNTIFVKGQPDGKSGQWDLKSAQDFVANPDNIFLLAYIDSQIAGMVSAYRLQRMDDRRAELFFYEIGVAQQFRRHGVARALIEELKQIAQAMGVDEMFVLTNHSNTAAMNLYQSTGGTPSAENDEVMFTYTL